MKKTLLLAAAMFTAACGEPGRWGTPVKLASARGIGGIHTSPQVAAAGRDEAMVVWQEPLDEDATHHRIQFSTYEHGRGWHTAETITETGPYPGSELAMNAAGEAALALADWPALSLLRFARGHGWSESRRSFGAGMTGGGRVGIGEDGTVVVLWADLLHRPPLLYASRFSPVTGWGSDDAISSSRAEAFQPDLTNVHLAVDARGDAVASWVETVFGPVYLMHSVWTNRARRGAPWGSPRQIDEALDDREAVLAGNKKGDAIVVWIRNELRVSLFRDATWADPAAIASPRYFGFRSEPALSESGYAMVVWLNWDERGDEPMALEAVRFDRAQGWSAPQALPLAHARVASIHTDVPGGVVVDHDGNATVVWNGEPGLVAYRYEVGRGWGQPQVIGMGYDESEVELALDDAGDVFVIWTAPDGTWVNRFGPSPP